MDYFDDLLIVAVSKMVTTRSGTPGAQVCGAIGVMLRGPAILCRGNAVFQLDAPFLYWSHREEITCWKTPPGVIRENLWVAANGARFERMLDSLDRMNPSADHISLENPGKIVEVIERMRGCFERNTNADRRRLPLLAEELMFEINETFSAEEISGKMSAVVKETALKMIHSPGNEFDIEAIARHSEVSSDYFRHCFQQYIGTSIHDFLLTQRYALAVRLLRETNRSIGDIGETCGFPVQRLFTRFFKNRSGVSPREFRKNVY